MTRWIEVAIGILLLCSTAHAVPDRISVQGQLVVAPGVPVSDAVFGMAFALYDAPEAVMPVWKESLLGVKTVGGAFSVVLGEESSLLQPTNLFEAYAELWLGVAVDGADELPRTAVSSVGWAMHAASAADLVCKGCVQADELALDVVRLPVGAVIDWWRPDPSVPIPAGFQVCDGGKITAPESPLLGHATPNLAGRFVRGVTDPAEIGSTGGSASPELSVDLPEHSHSIGHGHTAVTPTTASAGAHIHSVDLPLHFHSFPLDHDHAATSTAKAGAHTHAVPMGTHTHSVAIDHNHASATTNNAAIDGGYHGHDWVAANGDVAEENVAHGGQGRTVSGGSHSHGSHYHTADLPNHAQTVTSGNSAPATATSDSQGDHIHELNLPAISLEKTTSVYDPPPASSTSDGEHNHTVLVQIPALPASIHSGKHAPAPASVAGDTTPPFIGLLKLMRIF